VERWLVEVEGGRRGRRGKYGAVFAAIFIGHFLASWTVSISVPHLCHHRLRQYLTNFFP
jgi:hypothetical protein